MDIDSPPNARLKYSICGGDRFGQFFIDKTLGYVSLASEMDREKVTFESFFCFSAQSLLGVILMFYFNYLLSFSCLIMFWKFVLKIVVFPLYPAQLLSILKFLISMITHHCFLKKIILLLYR